MLCIESSVHILFTADLNLRTHAAFLQLCLFFSSDQLKKKTTLACNPKQSAFDSLPVAESNRFLAAIESHWSGSGWTESISLSTAYEEDFIGEFLTQRFFQEKIRILRSQLFVWTLRESMGFFSYRMQCVIAYSRTCTVYTGIYTHILIKPPPLSEAVLPATGQ